MPCEGCAQIKISCDTVLDSDGVMLSQNMWVMVISCPNYSGIPADRKGNSIDFDRFSGIRFDPGQ